MTRGAVEDKTDKAVMTLRELVFSEGDQQGRKSKKPGLHGDQCRVGHKVGGDMGRQGLWGMAE